MARTLYLENGSTEIIFAGETEKEKEKLQKIIREHLGRDCEELFVEVTTPEELDEDDWERIADGYHSLLTDTLNCLHEALEAPRLDRKKIERIHNHLNKNL